MYYLGLDCCSDPASCLSKAPSCNKITLVSDRVAVPHYPITLTLLYDLCVYVVMSHRVFIAHGVSSIDGTSPHPGGPLCTVLSALSSKTQ